MALYDYESNSLTRGNMTLDHNLERCITTIWQVTGNALNTTKAKDFNRD